MELVVCPYSRVPGFESVGEDHTGLVENIDFAAAKGEVDIAPLVFAKGW